MVRTNKIVDGQDNLGLAKDAGNALISYFGFKITGGRGQELGNVSSEEGRKSLQNNPNRNNNTYSFKLGK